jgi:hypothetical protein
MEAGVAILGARAGQVNELGSVSSGFGTCEVKNWLEVLDSWFFWGWDGLIKG